MKITKANWSADGSRLTMTVPFAKVDQESRTVSGFATLDNIDRQGDIVDTAASVEAFKAFRGNIREMHQPIAAGRLVSFSQEDFYDKQTNKNYSGVFVTAYVSKGAQDTWEKVLDGTLSGFSIGGEITESEPVFDKAHDRTVRVIKSYNLVELSLVDSPANQLANIFSVVKADSGDLVFKGIAVDTKTETVFWCATDQIAIASSEDSKACDVCGKAMQNIGWIESGDVGKADVVKRVVDNFLQTLDVPEVAKQADIDISEGGIEVANEEIANEVVEVEKSVAAPEVEAAAVEETVEAEAVAEEVVEKAAEVSEVEGTVEPDFAKALDDLKTFLADSLEKNATASAEQIESVRNSVEAVSKGVDEKLSELETRYDSMSKAVDTLKNNLGNVEKALTELDKSFAVKKSEELGGSTDKSLTKSDGIWQGRFLGVSDL